MLIKKDCILASQIPPAPHRERYKFGVPNNRRTKGWTAGLAKWSCHVIMWWY